MHGAGTLLGAAAGHAAQGQLMVPSGTGPDGGSLNTLRIVSYHLLEHDTFDPERCATELSEAVPATARFTPDRHLVDMTLSAAAIPLGLRYRDEAATLIHTIERMGAFQETTPETMTAALAVGAAVAAWSYGQRHLDVWMAVTETVGMSIHGRESDLGRAMRDGWTRADEEGHVSLLSVAPIRAVLHTAKLTAHDDSGGADGTVRDAAVSSAHFAFFVGAMVGARHGIRSWPWTVPHADWYREAGLRLLTGRTGVDDLRDPRQLF